MVSTFNLVPRGRGPSVQLQDTPGVQPQLGVQILAAGGYLHPQPRPSAAADPQPGPSAEQAPAFRRRQQEHPEL